MREIPGGPYSFSITKRLGTTQEPDTTHVNTRPTARRLAEYHDDNAAPISRKQLTISPVSGSRGTRAILGRCGTPTDP